MSIAQHGLIWAGLIGHRSVLESCAEDIHPKCWGHEGSWTQYSDFKFGHSVECFLFQLEFKLGKIQTYEYRLYRYGHRFDSSFALIMKLEIKTY